MTLRIGQCWITQRKETQETILEYMGRSGKQLCARKWIWYSGGNGEILEEHDVVVIAEGNHSMGAGTQIWMTYEEMFGE